MNLAERANSGLHAHVTNKIVQVAANRDIAVLDVGCGTGALLARLNGLGYKQLTGIDLDRPKQPLAGISFVEYDLDEDRLPFDDASLQLIVSVEVFEHIENLGTLLKEISRVMSPNGHLLITTPNVHSIEARLRYLLVGRLKQFDEIADPTHIQPIFLHPFRLLLNRHSLEIAECWGFPTDGSSPTSRGGLRALAQLSRLFGMRTGLPGDHLCLLIRHKADQAGSPAKSKRDLVAEAY